MSAFFHRYGLQIKQIGIIVLIAGFYAGYRHVPVINKSVDAAVTPAAAGITLLYGKITTPLYRASGVDLGFVQPRVDPAFQRRVEIAGYVKTRQAGPLVEMAVDVHRPLAIRHQALRALLKFDRSEDWIQPFLNELPRGGLGESESEILDALIKQIRAEGGVRNSLVRAYAEVAFSFMLQTAGRPAVRARAFRWLSDVLAEDAVFLIIPRLRWEDDPGVRREIENALWDVRAVSDPRRARDLLYPYYRNPTWPGLKVPVAVVLARLGYGGAVDYLRSVNLDDLPPLRQVDAKVAMARRPYPRSLRVTEQREILLAKRERARRQQYDVALEKRRRIGREQALKEETLASAAVEREASPAVVPDARSAQKADSNEEEVEPRAVAETEKPKTAPDTRNPVAKALPEAVEPAPALSGTDGETEPARPPAAIRKPAETAKVEPASGEKRYTGGFHRPYETSEAAPSDAVQAEVASLPRKERTIVPPPLDRESQKRTGYVDVIFEVTAEQAALFANPSASEAAQAALPKGAKGKADFFVRVGEEVWYRVGSKSGDGWVQAAAIKVYDLSPGGRSRSRGRGDDSIAVESREESTFFEANMEDAPLFSGPANDAERVGAIQPGTAYLASQSRKVGSNRWFFLQLPNETGGWVRGTDIRLADIQRPIKMVVPVKAGRADAMESAFAPEWVVASVKGVGVYSRASIAGEMIRRISPPDVYRVREVKSGGGKEWYRIETSSSESGWVQALDVSLTQPR